MSSKRKKRNSRGDVFDSPNKLKKKSSSSSRSSQSSHRRRIVLSDFEDDAAVTTTPRRSKRPRKKPKGAVKDAISLSEEDPIESPSPFKENQRQRKPRPVSSDVSKLIKARPRNFRVGSLTFVSPRKKRISKPAGSQVAHFSSTRTSKEEKESIVGTAPIPSSSKNRPALKPSSSLQDLSKWLSSSTPVSATPQPLSRDSSCVASSRQHQALQGLWIDTFAPELAVDLAVHSGKIKEVRDWIITNCLNLRLGKLSAKRLLILCGPAGCGKTATVRVLANELHLQLIEWSDRFSSKWLDEDGKQPHGFVNRMEEFRTFVLQSGRYHLKLTTENTEGNLVLLEDLPNLANADQTKTFVDTVHDLLLGSRVPTVLIVSDTFVGDSPIYSLLPDEILQSPQATVLRFRPVSRTNARKALKRVNEAACAKISADVLEKFADSSAGDIRHAVMSLQFFALGPRNKDSVLSCCAKDNTSSLFSALGRVLYNKRRVEAEPKTARQPGYKIYHGLGRPELAFDPDQLLKFVNMDPALFLSFLHENYLRFFSDVDDVALASSVMSEADLLSSQWEHRTILEGYTCSVAVRGLLFANTHEFQKTFQPFRKPEWFTVRTTMQSNQRTLASLFGTDDRSADFFSMNGCVTSIHHKLETIPYLFKMVQCLSRPMTLPHLSPYLSSDVHQSQPSTARNKVSANVRLTTGQANFVKHFGSFRSTCFGESERLHQFDVVTGATPLRKTSSPTMIINRNFLVSHQLELEEAATASKQQQILLEDDIEDCSD